MFHNVLSVSQWFMSISQCFLNFSKCLIMFENCMTIGNCHISTFTNACVCQFLQGSAIMPQKWSHAKLCPEWSLECLCSYKTISKWAVWQVCTVSVQCVPSRWLLTCYLLDLSLQRVSGSLPTVFIKQLYSK